METGTGIFYFPNVAYPNGQKTDYSYFDNMGDQRLKEIKNVVTGVLSNTPLSDFQYTYNPVGTIATWQQQTDNNTPTVYNLTYDSADQLTGAVQTDTDTDETVSSNAYGYDPAGNRLSETTPAGTTTGRFNNLNQLTAYGTGSTAQTVSGHVAVPASVTVNAVPATVTQGTNFSATVPLPGGTNVLSVVATDTGGNTTTQRFQAITNGTLPPSLSYDANGNTLTDEKGNSYQWDALNRLVRISYPNGSSSTFAYDGSSRRIQILEKDNAMEVTSTKNYLWVSSEIAEERSASNTITKRFFPQGEQQNGTAYYYTRDHLGSVREMLNSSGAILTRYSYDPYGRTTTNHLSGSVDATMRYADMYWHDPSQNYGTKYRIYRPNIGLWDSRDPEKGTGIFSGKIEIILSFPV